MRFILFLISFILISSCTNYSLDKEIQGRWNLKIIEYQDPETQIWTQSSWMKNGTGILEYNPEGRMNVHFTPDKFEDHIKTQDSISEAQKMEEFEHLSSDYWYVGDYELVENNSHITHKRVMHSNPWDWGIIVKRKVEFLGDTLVLTSTERETNLRLKWVRS